MKFLLTCTAFFFFILLATGVEWPSNNPKGKTISPNQPTISFTFDDGNPQDIAGYRLEEWNELILDALDEHKLKAIFFVMGKGKETKEGQYLLQSWNDRGHYLGNHSFLHLYYNSKDVSFEEFETDFYKGHALVKQYSNHLPLFRFPYLKEGNTKAKVEQFRAVLAQNEYKNGSVTIDASDWYINNRLKKRLKEDPGASTEGYKRYYIQHLLDRAAFYEQLAFELTGRHIQHNILLHHNLTSALFLEDLITAFKKEGWNCINAHDAFKDPIYKSQPTLVPAGESLIWALAKEEGTYEAQLRYPAEDGRYEKEAMDALGL
ncbi:MAG: polysaccharide deacetylase family protein [Aureispira sp.]